MSNKWESENFPPIIETSFWNQSVYQTQCWKMHFKTNRTNGETSKRKNSQFPGLLLFIWNNHEASWGRDFVWMGSMHQTLNKLPLPTIVDISMSLSCELSVLLWMSTSCCIHHIQKSSAFLPCAFPVEIWFLPSNAICCKSAGWPRRCLVHPVLQIVSDPCQEVHRLYLQSKSEPMVLWLFEWWKIWQNCRNIVGSWWWWWWWWWWTPHLLLACLLKPCSLEKSIFLQVSFV